MADIVLFHNPGCGKSRAALEFLRGLGVDFDVVQYLKQPPDRATLGRIIDGMPDPPVALVRVKDRKFTALGVDPATLTTRDAVVELLVAHPEVMERPVVLRGAQAVVGRPTERIADLVG